jgi:hypothetical protein
MTSFAANDLVAGNKTLIPRFTTFDAEIFSVEDDPGRDISALGRTWKTTPIQEASPTGVRVGNGTPPPTGVAVGAGVGVCLGSLGVGVDLVCAARLPVKRRRPVTRSTFEIRFIAALLLTAGAPGRHG